MPIYKMKRICSQNWIAKIPVEKVFINSNWQESLSIYGATAIIHMEIWKKNLMAGDEVFKTEMKKNASHKNGLIIDYWGQFVSYIFSELEKPAQKRHQNKKKVLQIKETHQCRKTKNEKVQSTIYKKKWRYEEHN